MIEELKMIVHCKKNICCSGGLANYFCTYIQIWLHFYPPKLSSYIRIYIHLYLDNFPYFLTGNTIMISTKNCIVGNFLTISDIAGF